MTMMISKKWYVRAEAVIAYSIAAILVGIWFPDDPYSIRFIETGALFFALGVVLLVLKATRDLIVKPLPGEVQDAVNIPPPDALAVSLQGCFIPVHEFPAPRRPDREGWR